MSVSEVGAATKKIIQFEKTALYRQIRQAILSESFEEAQKLLLKNQKSLSKDASLYFESYILELGGDYEAAFESFKAMNQVEHDEIYELHFKRLKSLSVFASSQATLLFKGGQIIFQDPLQAILASDIKIFLEASAYFEADQESVSIYLIDSPRLFTYLSGRFFLEQGVSPEELALQDAFYFHHRLYLKDPRLMKQAYLWSFYLEALLPKGKSFAYIKDSLAICKHIGDLLQKRSEYAAFLNQKTELKEAVIYELQKKMNLTFPSWINLNFMFNISPQWLTWQTFILKKVQANDCQHTQKSDFQNFLKNVKPLERANGLSEEDSPALDLFSYAFLGKNEFQDDLLFEKRFHNKGIRHLYLYTLLKERNLKGYQFFDKSIQPYKNFKEVSILKKERSQLVNFQDSIKKAKTADELSLLEQKIWLKEMAYPYQVEFRKDHFSLLQKYEQLSSEQKKIHKVTSPWPTLLQEKKAAHLLKQKIYDLENRQKELIW